MQSSILDVELQRTLDELCADLFATSALDDCNAILQSLALLAETFPQAQTLLGRLLSQNDNSQPRYITISKLSSLSTNFLYKKETARSTASLFAALANSNVRNQRRIVQSTTGVKLDIDHNRYDLVPAPRSALYALTVPSIATNTYRRWRKRQRELQNCRLPTGVPPAHDGVPMPCYCDHCLGADQFLSTWQQHFHDLSRWSRDLDRAASATDSSPLPSLSTEDFFRVFLADHQIRACTVGEALGSQKGVDGSYTDRANRHPSLLYYFVPPEEASAATPKTPVQFNPLHHITAIAIAAEIHVDVVRGACRQDITNQNERPSTNSAESNILTSEQVILFTGTTEVKACVVAQINEPPDSDDGSPVRPVDGTDEFSADFCKLDEQHGQLVLCESLANGIGSEDSDLTETVRELLLDMLSCCDSSEQIPLAASSFCHVNSQEDIPILEPECIQTSPLQVMNARIIMTANLSDQVLQIDCMVSNTEDNLPGSFSARIAQQELVSTDNGRLGLLYLSDEALESLLQRCRICTCDEEAHEESDTVYLRLNTGEKRGRVDDAPDTSDEISQHAVQDSIKKSYASTRIPLSGLSPAAKRDLARLNILVSEEKYLGLASEALTTMMKELAKVVADCNERISYLALARDKELVRSIPEAHRSAAISRCRHCRDLLIQLGKKLALQVKGLDASLSISQEKLSRVTKVVRSSIHDVLALSETFDPWETPDARVEKLNLDRRLWASGFPDAAYFQDTDKRQRENRKKQQQLSRQLLLQQKKKRSKDEARSKQHRG